MMTKKISYIIIIIIFCAITFSGYLHEQDIDDLAYVIALGFDVGNEDTLKITFQISIPSENGSSTTSASSSSSSSEKGSSDTLTKSIECSSFYSGLNSINSIISKDLNLSHCKFVVFSEELASKGISEYIYTLENSPELRSNCNIIVSKPTAEEFLNSTNPILENSTAKYYEIITNASKYTGYTSDITLNYLYTTISDTFREPCAILGTIDEQSDTNSNQSDSSSNSESSSGSDSSGKSQLKLGGLAVFKDDKFVGELSITETIPYLLLTNSLKESLLSIPSPFDESKTFDLHLSGTNDIENFVSISGSTPQITTNIRIDGTILSNNNYLDFSSKENIKKAEESASKYIQELIVNYYEKTAREYQADITGLGKYAVHLFPTINDWNNFDWSNKYKNAQFYVNTKVTINSSYFIS